MMELLNAEVSVVAVIVCIIANIVIGMIWFNPKLFGTKWAKLTGHNMTDGGAKPADYGASMLGGAVMALVLSIIGQYTAVIFYLSNLSANFEITTMSNIMYVALAAVLVWIGFVVTSASNQVIWEKRPNELFMINMGHQLVSLLGMAVIIGVFMET